MKCKRMSAMVLATVLCFSSFSVTAYAYTDESAEAQTEVTEETETIKETEEVQESVSVKEQEMQTTEEIPYDFFVDEEGNVTFSFNGEEYTFNPEDLENSETIGKVVTGGSGLNVRTGAGMNYEIIDQLRPGEEVTVIGTEGDWYQITVPEKNGYVHSDYVELMEQAGQNSEMDRALLMLVMSMLAQNKADENEPALTPDGNMTLVDDVGTSANSGKQFITAVTKNGNYFYLIIDRDDKGKETVHFLNQVDEADLLQLMDEEEAAKHQKPEPEPVTREPEATESEPEVTDPVEEKPKANPLPAIFTLLLLAGGGGFFVYKKMKDKKKEQEAAKPDPDADYVDDEEDYGYSEEYEDEEEESDSDAEDNEPV